MVTFGIEAGLLDVPEEWIGHLGGWAIKGPAHRYVETVERRIAKMQSAVAKRLRDETHGPDLVDEDKLFHELRVYMSERGISEVEQAEQIARLCWFSPDDESEPPKKPEIVTEDVEKYFRRVSFPNGMCWFDLFKCLAHSQFGSGVCECA